MIKPVAACLARCTPETPHDSPHVMPFSSTNVHGEQAHSVSPSLVNTILPLVPNLLHRKQVLTCSGFFSLMGTDLLALGFESQVGENASGSAFRRKSNHQGVALGVSDAIDRDKICITVSMIFIASISAAVADVPTN